MIFLGCRRRNRIDRRRVGEGLGLTDQRGRRDLDHHETRVEAGVLRQEPRQTVGQGRIDQPRQTTLGNRRQIGQRQGDVIEHRGDRRPVEISPGDHTAVGENHRVVGRGVKFDLQDLPRVLESVPGRPVDLRRTPQ